MKKKPHKILRCIEHTKEHYRKSPLFKDKNDGSLEKVIAQHDKMVEIHKKTKKRNEEKRKNKVREVFSRFLKRIEGMSRDEIDIEINSDIMELSLSGGSTKNFEVEDGFEVEETKMQKYKHDHTKLLEQNAKSLLEQFPEDQELSNLWNGHKYQEILDVVFKRDMKKREFQHFQKYVNDIRKRETHKKLTHWDFIGSFQENPFLYGRG